MRLWRLAWWPEHSDLFERVWDGDGACWRRVIGPLYFRVASAQQAREYQDLRSARVQRDLSRNLGDLYDEARREVDGR